MYNEQGKSGSLKGCMLGPQLQFNDPLFVVIPAKNFIINSIER